MPEIKENLNEQLYRQEGYRPIYRNIDKTPGERDLSGTTPEPPEILHYSEEPWNGKEVKRCDYLGNFQNIHHSNQG